MLGALYAIARRLRNAAFFRRGQRRCVTVLETTMLTPHVSVYLLRVGKRHLLVGASSNGARTLAHWTPPTSR